MIKLDLPNYDNIVDMCKISIKEKLDLMKDVAKKGIEFSIEYAYDLTKGSFYWTEVGEGIDSHAIPTFYQDENYLDKVLILFLHTHPSYEKHSIAIAPSHGDIMYESAIFNVNIGEIAKHYQIPINRRGNKSYEEFAKDNFSWMHTSGIVGFNNSNLDLLVYQTPKLIEPQERIEKEYDMVFTGHKKDNLNLHPKDTVSSMRSLGFKAEFLRF